jgi:hypothetical protein
MHIVDRRLNPGSKSLENRQRFLRRAKGAGSGRRQEVLPWHLSNVSKPNCRCVLLPAVATCKTSWDEDLIARSHVKHFKYFARRELIVGDEAELVMQVIQPNGADRNVVTIRMQVPVAAV